MNNKSKSGVLETWEAIRDELRKLRGKNRFRGNEEHLLPRQEIRLYRENRGNQLSNQVVVIHLTERMEDLWAEGLSQVSGKVSEFGTGAIDDRWRLWLGAIVDECRGANYLHTESESAPYRKLLLKINELS
jgi:hypothetical protein